MVCQNPGKYFSLCLSTGGKRAKTLKFCKYCEQVSILIQKHDIHISDLWEDAIVCDKSLPSEIDERAYPSRFLQTIDELIKLSNERLETSDVASISLRDDE